MKIYGQSVNPHLPDWASATQSDSDMNRIQLTIGPVPKTLISENVARLLHDAIILSFLAYLEADTIVRVLLKQIIDT